MEGYNLICLHCGNSNRKQLSEDPLHCDKCGSNNVMHIPKTEFDTDLVIGLPIKLREFDIIREFSEDPKFVQAMIDLHDNDIIEYTTKINMIEQQIQERKNANKPHCPNCNSTNIKKISSSAKVAGALAFGLFSKTAKSQFKCNDCGYKW